MKTFFDPKDDKANLGVPMITGTRKTVSVDPLDQRLNQDPLAEAVDPINKERYRDLLVGVHEEARSTWETPTGRNAEDDGRVLRIKIELITKGPIAGHWIAEVTRQCNSSPSGESSLGSSYPRSYKEALDFVQEHLK